MIYSVATESKAKASRWSLLHLDTALSLLSFLFSLWVCCGCGGGYVVVSVLSQLFLISLVGWFWNGFCQWRWRWVAGFLFVVEILWVFCFFFFFFFGGGSSGWQCWYILMGFVGVVDNGDCWCCCGGSFFFCNVLWLGGFVVAIGNVWVLSMVAISIVVVVGCDWVLVL